MLKILIFILTFNLYSTMYSSREALCEGIKTFDMNTSANVKHFFLMADYVVMGHILKIDKNAKKPFAAKITLKVTEVFKGNPKEIKVGQIITYNEGYSECPEDIYRERGVTLEKINGQLVNTRDRFKYKKAEDLRNRFQKLKETITDEEVLKYEKIKASIKKSNKKNKSHLKKKNQKSENKK